MVYKNLLETIGNTPIVELKHYSNNPRVKIYAKLEGTNPGGSIKDRVAREMIASAKINPDKILIEATSGNTGIGMAMVSARLGHKFVAVMKRSVSVERIKLLESFGAEVVLADNSIEQVKVMVKENKKYLWLNQYENRANVMAHFLGTGAEIVRDVPELTHLVAGMGTGGTIMGAGRRLKQYSQNIKVYGIEPGEESAIQGLRNYAKYTPRIFNRDELDGVLSIEDGPAFEMAKDLFKREGLSVGISSGAALWGAVEISRKIKEGIVVTIFPDRGDRYISTRLFN